MISLPTNFRATPRFELRERLGQGGMGVVYSAFDKEKETLVALKALRNTEADALLRFKREFRSLQELSHPNLVSLYELFASDGNWFYSMELIAGQSFIDFVHYRETDEEDVDVPLSAGSDETMPHLDAERLALSSSTRPWFHAERLQVALAQLLHGLSAIHAAGKVHRDIKPQNILVTAQRRVVLLDFGLVADTEAFDRSSSSVVGTVDYMAPEQASGASVGPAADLYAVGVVLYEALTGRMPYLGPAMQILGDKQRVDPLRPASVAVVPPALDELCMALLRRDPATRPSLEETLARLGQGGAALVRRTSSGVLSSFVGRRRQLEQLANAFDASRKGEPKRVLVEGASGVGKSALVRHFVKQLDQDVPGLVLLFGRYYEREAVPYRALDAIMDAVSRFLMRLPGDQAESFLPLDAPLLAALFPALRAVEAFSRGTQHPSNMDPRELRTRLFRAVRELFLRLVRKRPVVLVIDDLQWADADSLAVFAELLRPPEAPALLLIMTSRPDENGGSDDTASKVLRLEAHERLRLDRLDPDEARTLARLLLGNGSAIDPGALAEEAQGHPLLVDALVRHAIRRGGTLASLQLDDALRARMDELAPEMRRVLDLIAVAGGPITPEVATRALQLELSEFLRAAATLRIEQLVRPTRFRNRDGLEAHHDRVRETLVVALSVDARRDLHERLARALESFEDSDPEALFIHWRGAGHRANAARYAAVAAERAAHALAFDRAQRLYREAIDRVDEPEHKRQLQVRLAEALANDGRGMLAAEAYKQAIPGAGTAEALELGRLVAEQLLRSGHIDDGMAALKRVLAAVGLRLPATPRAALLGLLWRRARLRLRGLTFKPTDQSQIVPSALQRIDVCWSVATVLGMVDTVRGNYFQTVHLWLALRAGEPYRVARALALEAPFTAITGESARARTVKVLDELRRVSAPLQQPYLEAWQQAATGISAALTGRFKLAYEHCRRGEELFRTRCTNIQWELGTVQFFLNWSLAHLGELSILRERVPTSLRIAEERSDLYGAAAHRAGLPSLIWLADDDLASADLNLLRARGAWNIGGGGASYHVEQWWHLVADVNLRLYRGEVERAYHHVEESWGPLRRSLLLRVQLTRNEFRQVRARVLLAMAERHVSDRARLCGEARQIGREMVAELPARTATLGLVVLAGVAALQGHREDAVVQLTAAIERLTEHEMILFAHAARYWLVRLDGAERHSREHELVQGWILKHKVKRPERFFAMLAPGFGALLALRPPDEKVKSVDQVGQSD